MTAESRSAPQAALQGLAGRAGDCLAIISNRRPATGPNSAGTAYNRASINNASILCCMAWSAETVTCKATRVQALFLLAFMWDKYFCVDWLARLGPQSKGECRRGLPHQQPPQPPARPPRLNIHHTCASVHTHTPARSTAHPCSPRTQCPCTPTMT